MKVYVIENSFDGKREFFGKKGEAYTAFRTACRRQPYLIHKLIRCIAKKQCKETMLAFLKDDGWEASQETLEMYNPLTHREVA